jgi:hypothetical protein
MRSRFVAGVAMGVASVGMVSPAYSALRRLHPEGHRDPVSAPEQSGHVDNFQHHDEQREGEAWQLPQARSRVCGHECGCRR